MTMSTVTASDARSRLYRLIDETADSHQPVTITGKRANAVLISEADWSAIQETLYLTGIPGMRDAIVAGMRTPVTKCGAKLQW
jgi:prevent-host-death family protein